MAVGTPRLQPFNACLGGGGGHRTGSTPRPWPFCARRGRGEATWRLGRPGRSRPVLAGAEGKTLGRKHARAVTVLRTLGQGRSYLAAGTHRPQPICVSRGRRKGGEGTCTPRPWPFCASRGGWEDTG